MFRSVLSSLLFITALGFGVLVAGLASRNRARGANLDQRQLESEIRQRQNRVQRSENQHQEYRLIQGFPASTQPPQASISY